MTIARRLRAPVTLVIGLSAAVGVWAYATASPIRSLGVLVLPLGIFAIAGFVMFLIAPRMGAHPFIKVVTGILLGLLVSQGAAHALIHPSPGSTAIVVYGSMGLLAGTAVGFASLARTRSRPVGAVTFAAHDER